MKDVIVGRKIMCRLGRLEHFAGSVFRETHELIFDLEDHYKNVW